MIIHILILVESQEKVLLNQAGSTGQRIRNEGRGKRIKEKGLRVKL
jgi:hypothetical protein